MPTDNAYDEILDKLADTHQQRLADALVTLEERVADVMADAPLQGGKLFDTEWAINARPAIKEAMDEAYLSQVDDIVRGYGAVANEAQDMLSTYGDFTKLDSTVVNQLQRLSFQGFESVANEYLDVLANEVYQSTLTGRSFNDTVKNLRQTINGVYIQSDDVEAQRLVDIANSGSPAAAKEAAEQLRTKFARDRAGNNLRRYSTQMAQDSLMQFDASINTAIGKASGATKWKYYGDVIRDSRPFCVEHANQVFDEDEIESTWAGSWQGKSSGDPFIVRGGYNCRHHWRPVFDEEDIVSQPEATEEPVAVPSIPLGMPPLQKKKELKKSYDERTQASNLKGSEDAGQRSKTGYPVNKDGTFAARFDHGHTRRSKLTRDEFNAKQFGENQLAGFSDEALSLVEPTLLETDKLAAKYGVPRIRTVVPAKGKNTVADMGDGVLGLNKDIYNGYGKKAYTSQEALDGAVNDLAAKTKTLRTKLDEQVIPYLAVREEMVEAGLNYTPELLARYKAEKAAYDKTFKSIAKSEKALKAARRNAEPKVASTYVRGGNKADRPWASGGYFDSDADLGKSTIFHEFGHNVHQQYFVTRNKMRRPPIEVWLDGKFKDKPFFPTQYSQANPQEWWAENFALHNMGRKDLVDKDIAGLLDAIAESNGNLTVYDGFNFETGEYI